MFSILWDKERTHSSPHPLTFPKFPLFCRLEKSLLGLCELRVLKGEFLWGGGWGRGEAGGGIVRRMIPEVSVK